MAQLQGIYNCTFTNWNQVGGSSGQIERYWPQAGSGTRSFAQSDLLGFDPTTISNGATCPAVVLTQENSGQTIAANGDQQTAVVPYSAGNWVAQARGTAPDQRSGQLMHSLNGQSPVRQVSGQFQLAVRNSSFPTAPVAEANVSLNDPTPDYPGIRYVFNVISSESPSYTSAIRYVGFTNVDKGETAPLCSGKYATTLSNFGFGPLDTTIGGTNLAGSTCRRFS